MKIHSINERMPYVASLHQVSEENDKKVRRFRLGHLLFTVQLHSWEVDDFDKKSIMAKEELLKEKLPKKIRESLSTANHKYDSKLTAGLAASADKIHSQLEKLQKMRDDAKAKMAEAEAAKAEADAKAKAEAEANAKAAAEAEALSKMLDAMLTARGVPAAPPAECQQTPANQPADPITPPTDPIGKLKQELDNITAEITSAEAAVKAAEKKEDKNKVQCKLNALNQKRTRIIEQIAAAAMATV